MAGNYNINILYEGKHVPGSPFHAAVRADLDTRSIRCFGPGLETKGVYIDAHESMKMHDHQRCLSTNLLHVLLLPSPPSLRPLLDNLCRFY